MENNLPFFLNTYNPISQELLNILEKSYKLTEETKNEYMTPEHVLYTLLEEESMANALDFFEGDVKELKEKIEEYIKELETFPEGVKFTPTPSFQFMEMAKHADRISYSSGKTSIEIPHLIKALLDLESSTGSYLLKDIIGNEEGLFLGLYINNMKVEDIEELEEETDEEFDLEVMDLSEPKSKKGKNWKKWLECINDIYKFHNPLIGREEELRKTITVLCRKDKNNPLHIGEPGVGKTALVYGLASMIEEGRVPDRLKGAKIYRMDLGNLIAGSQYRGDFEKRIKNIMDGVSKEENPIIYIDEIHNLVGAGAVGESSMDASNILKPYLENGEIRFIGATTYDEYKRHFAKSKGIVRRFTNIDIAEPSIEESINILRQLQEKYENYHEVRYTDEAIEFAVKGSAKHINDRYLPDKAIDLIDESGARKQLEETDRNKVVDKETISAVLAKLCKVESLAITEEDPRDLERLEERISAQLFGQEKAVKEVSESILMSKAGLEDENKPIASLLFVGPTGVGKTELSKLLSKELGIELIRFDMSEYSEKHTVAKLIGSPAGYVGYEDGGLLTDAIRKTPNAVLLLDEIEKAHPDIFNILLQVMDYAKLTDNKGNKADFRNVVLIMTSNAGAQYAAQSNVGFASNITRGDAMLKQVKRVFKPEFLNRLSATVVFNDMTREMASLIIDKKLKELRSKLKTKNVELKITVEAKNYLLEKGFTKEFGARELDRVIQHELKRILMKEILFGELKNGGEIEIILEKGKLIVCRK